MQKHCHLCSSKQSPQDHQPTSTYTEADTTSTSGVFITPEWAGHLVHTNTGGHRLLLTLAGSERLLSDEDSWLTQDFKSPDHPVSRGAASHWRVFSCAVPRLAEPCGAWAADTPRSLIFTLGRLTRPCKQTSASRAPERPSTLKQMPPKHKVHAQLQTQCSSHRLPTN